MYDFIYDEEAHIEINVLLCTDLGAAYAFIDDLYMELHFEHSSKPDRIRLRASNSEEHLLLFETHFDSVR
jgi:hypothetical protein